MKRKIILNIYNPRGLEKFSTSVQKNTSKKLTNLENRARKKSCTKNFYRARIVKSCTIFFVHEFVHDFFRDFEPWIGYNLANDFEKGCCKLSFFLGSNKIRCFWLQRIVIILGDFVKFQDPTQVSFDSIAFVSESYAVLWRN